MSQLKPKLKIGDEFTYTKEMHKKEYPDFPKWGNPLYKKLVGQKFTVKDQNMGLYGVLENDHYQFTIADVDFCLDEKTKKKTPKMSKSKFKVGDKVKMLRTCGEFYKGKIYTITEEGGVLFLTKSRGDYHFNNSCTESSCGDSYWKLVKSKTPKKKTPKGKTPEWKKIVVYRSAGGTRITKDEVIFPDDTRQTHAEFTARYNQLRCIMRKLDALKKDKTF